MPLFLALALSLSACSPDSVVLDTSTDEQQQGFDQLLSVTFGDSSSNTDIRIFYNFTISNTTDDTLYIESMGGSDIPFHRIIWASDSTTLFFVNVQKDAMSQDIAVAPDESRTYSTFVTIIDDEYQGLNLSPENDYFLEVYSGCPSNLTSGLSPLLPKCTPIRSTSFPFPFPNQSR